LYRKQGDEVENTYLKFASINVNDKTEKKQNLTYLSWAWAVDQLLRVDPNATWEYEEPKIFGNATMMVFCTVNACGKSMTAQLPVMNHKNQPIPEPDAFQVNTAMQRCLAKAIALHGLGLYIYAGEDLPYEEEKPAPPEIKPIATAQEIQAAKDKLVDCESVEELRKVYGEFTDALKAVTKEYAASVADQLKKVKA
jgi:Protein of unknown function (DUF1071)